MDRLWSPWRSIHVAGWDSLAEADRDSVFSRMAEEHDDEKNLILWRGESVFVVMNLYPYNNGHCLVVPFRQVATLQDLSLPERSELMETVARTTSWIDRALAPQGFNIGMNLGIAAGAGIPGHLHVHIVPRWSGDTAFMSTLADTRVVPEALEATYKKLCEAASIDL